MDNIYVYIIIMTGVTYLIRMLPLTLIHSKINHPFFRSFLYYVPYAALSAMVFPAILTSTNNIFASVAGFIVALVLSYREKSLITVALASCICVYIINLCVL